MWLLACNSHRLGFASLSPLLVSMAPQVILFPWILISLFAVGQFCDHCADVSCEDAHPHHWILATPMNFFLEMQILNVVVNRGLIESLCNYSQCFPTGCGLLFVGNVCLMGVMPGMCLSGLWHNFPSIVQGASCFWLPGHPSV